MERETKRVKGLNRDFDIDIYSFSDEDMQKIRDQQSFLQRKLDVDNLCRCIVDTDFDETLRMIERFEKGGETYGLTNADLNKLRIKTRTLRDAQEALEVF